VSELTNVIGSQVVIMALNRFILLVFHVDPFGPTLLALHNPRLFVALREAPHPCVEQASTLDVVPGCWAHRSEPLLMFK
jgi:hypothetical protein